MPRPRLRMVSLIMLCLSFLVIPPVLAQEVTHIVQPGENLFRISLRYGVDVDTLAAANGISNTWQIYAGQSLVIPSATALPPAAPTAEAPADTAAPATDTATSATPTYHTVQRGEHLASIARQYGMTPEALATLNNLTNPNLVYAGQQLMITAGTPVEVAAVPEEAAPAEVAPVEAAPVENPAQEAVESTTYVVQRGDHLASIANRFGVSWLTLAQANNIYNADHIVVGQTLVIPGVAADGTTLDMGIVEAPAAPAASVAVGRSIIVDLSDSRIYAYENGVLVRNVLVSTGLPATPTVQGDFTIQRKYVAQTMSGPGYYLPDVPYVMYFYAGYAIHGTYWHNNFGVPMSHGCVNLPTPEAEWFYNWAEVGTPVHVQF